MANEKKYLEFLDIPDGNGGSERWYSKDAEAQASIAKVASAIGINPDDFVDLGLPSGTLWAKCNVGANAETGYGNYYMYGKGATQYSNGDTPYDGTEDPLDAEHDTATQILGEMWCMPTRTQVNELLRETTPSWETNFNGSGINGCKLTAANGNYIFIPAAGTYWNGSLSGVGTDGEMWTSSSAGSDGAYKMYVMSINNTAAISNDGRSGGFSIRPVLSKTILDLIEDSKLNPVNINTLTPSSTFRKNAVVGINGVLYRSTAATSNLPCTLVVQDGAFVVNIVNGKKAFVVSNGAPNQDWEIWTDAAIEYWIESITTALNGKQATISDLSTIRSNAQNAVKPTDTFTAGGTDYQVSELLQAVANLMANTIVTQP